MNWCSSRSSWTEPKGCKDQEETTEGRKDKALASIDVEDDIYAFLLLEGKA
jgi:hypothetical protein